MSVDGTGAAARLCAAVAHRLDQGGFVDLATSIREELPSYRHFPEGEHTRTLRDFSHFILENIPDGRGPGAEHLEYARRAASRRAHLGVSAYDVLRSFHVGTRTLWAALRASPEASDETLILLVEPLSRWTDGVAATVLDAYVAESPAREAREARTRRRFFAQIGDTDSHELVADLARELAFTVSGEFQAVCSPRQQWPETEVENLQRAAHRLPGVVACGLRGSVMVMLGQDTDVDELVRTARSIGGVEIPMGIGLVRSGMTGVAVSITDAERSMRAAQVGGVREARFEECWLEASLLDSRVQLEPMLARVLDVGSAHPELAHAVRAFAECGFSLTRAAEALQLHPNSVGYRLSRWHELSGADPRTFAGLVRSVVGSRLSGVDGA